MLRIKRTYDPPSRTDGLRMLVERLWPRGTRKEALPMHAWVKDVAPSGKLRQWFDHRPERWDEFRRRYHLELDAKPEAWRPLLSASRGKTVTLLYSSHDVIHNSAVALREYLTKHQRRAETHENLH